MVWAAACLVTRAAGRAPRRCRRPRRWPAGRSRATGRTSAWPRSASSAATSSTIESEPGEQEQRKVGAGRDRRSYGTTRGRSTTWLSTGTVRQPGCRTRRSHARPPTVTIPTSPTTASPSTGPNCTTSRPGTTGSPVLLVHGFPETWWAFHKLIPLLADTTGSSPSTCAASATPRPPGPSTTAPPPPTDLAALIEHLDLGPVHLTGQDISGPTTFRLAATHPELVRSYTAIETGLPGFGLEALADVTHGGAWHIGVLAAPASRSCCSPGASARSSPSTLPVPGATPGRGHRRRPRRVRPHLRPPGRLPRRGRPLPVAAREGDEIPGSRPEARRARARRRRRSGDFTAATMRQVATDVTAVRSTGSATTPRWRRPTGSRTRSSPSSVEWRLTNPCRGAPSRDVVERRHVRLCALVLAGSRLRGVEVEIETVADGLGYPEGPVPMRDGLCWSSSSPARR